MQHLKVSGAVRPQKWSLGVKWLNYFLQPENDGRVTKIFETNLYSYKIQTPRNL